MATVTRNETRVPAGKSEAWAYTLTFLDCGHCADETLAPGTEVDCKRCAWQQQARDEIRAAHEAGRLSHTRSRGWCGATQIHAYVYDATSPTGVRHLATLDDTPANCDFLRELSGTYSPLSPTEGR